MRFPIRYSTDPFPAKVDPKDAADFPRCPACPCCWIETPAEKADGRCMACQKEGRR